MANSNKKGFTLIELVIVIVILAILGSIWLISMNWYSAKSRNWVRINDIQNIEKALELYSTQKWAYPMPSTGDITSISWDLLWKQWSLDNDVFKQLSIIDKLPVDPKTKENYWYSKSFWLEEFQLKYSLEWEKADNNVYAITKTRDIISWNYNWVFNVSKDWKYYASPSLFIVESNIDTTNWNNFYTKENSDKIHFTVSQVSSERPKTKDNYVDFATNLETAYNKETIKEIPVYKTIVSYSENADTDKERTNRVYLTETLLWKKSSVTYEEIIWAWAKSKYICFGWPTPVWAILSNNDDTKLTDNFVWQDDFPSEPCYYTCPVDEHVEWAWACVTNFKQITCSNPTLPSNTVYNSDWWKNTFTSTWDYWQKKYLPETTSTSYNETLWDCNYKCADDYYRDSWECVNWCKIWGPLWLNKCTIKP